MRWRNLLFAHWTVDPRLIRPLIPANLELDLFEGSCYVGAVPFLMENVTPRFVPPIPGLHAFPELNLRTYVTAGGKPGVWFFSLDAGQKLAVRVARRFFYLPYFDAAFDIHQHADAISCASRRTHSGAPTATLAVRYQPTGGVYFAEPGTLDHWLTARYCLYSADANSHVYRGDIDHAPWPLQPARAEIQENKLGDWLGIPLNGPPVSLLYADTLDVRAWLIERVGDYLYAG